MNELAGGDRCWIAAAVHLSDIDTDASSKIAECLALLISVSAVWWTAKDERSDLGLANRYMRRRYKHATD